MEEKLKKDLEQSPFGFHDCLYVTGMMCDQLSKYREKK